mmetsp:Transcript_18729/g.46820  ORF Transcript_18729/g.46820 Transcript_18729/m.46820 type:complete len:356 (+) Transcript_18729:281-1348(+)|eukprot:CAMPEP_0178983894 /NCGR_PEP_ID=MMETSP0795-20121207/1311_1 /TAXON_ID=88552 /ORGANISM="Amoebophrya sp., Strain Ameob2" /LENGTH=355 /DNA_ID=CAMNT_0020674713 /DNA_START=173 /DNA_END=1240 /DNA_ORIENTATION=-
MQRLGSWFVKKLDKDGDGRVTIDEVEDIVEETSEKIRKAAAPVQSFLQKYKWTGELAAGYVGCFYGGNFSHLYLCAAAFKSTEGQQVLSHLAELRDITKESTKRFVEHMGSDGAIIVASSSGTASNDGSPDDQESDGSVEVPSNTFMALLSSIEPDRLLSCVRSVYTGFLVALCSTINDNAAKLGLGLTLGDRIATFMMSIVERCMDSAEQKMIAADAANDNDEKTAADKKKDEKKLALKKKQTNKTLAWTKLVVRGACSSLGVFISWKLKDMAATWSTCHWGGHKISTSFFQLVAHEDAALQEMLGFAMGGLGFAYHVRHFNNPQLPGLLQPFLMPLSLLESVLRGITLGSSQI